MQCNMYTPTDKTIVSHMAVLHKMLNDSGAKYGNTQSLQLYNQLNTSMIKHWAPFSPCGIQSSSELNTKEQRLFSSLQHINNYIPRT